ncbi:DUF86 domain-containing protein [Bacillus cytotoxicus]|uniref:DUF86 domain-containing protein n=2 Tax=Bacillus cytotoxicus TaxID=580165 RepID=A0AAX2CM98_9BACI|nr:MULTISPECIES: DUF86 domain-containing protein [Bacillus cereus group]ABS23763.1 protein of unknown function DUF86 [Bacillus cytotoxicus NVH 391-98]AWC34403.1 DUF86 domain-containing protein [Bacillus cytotoxicus]AWC38401.1 DUF86 domain-containing protein [Bacillus cytotoxicus]AWC46373.1 DUF86 domain-containing protein [Bacillus cytotoxicus]AWC62619.1 DUF86 domain-containing protein [Bacillus cytotoxicus]
MYFVDRKKIEKMLTCLEQVVDTFQEKKIYETNFEYYALERMSHLIIDCILDVGNAMIDGFIMRDPGSYEDIIDILMDEKVISGAEGEGLKEVILLRKMLMQDYIEMNHEKIYETIQRQIPFVQTYPANIRRYLEKELGPVSAFVAE